jgi:hypothetical protein
MAMKMSDSNVENVETLGLIDSGAGGKFIDQNYARKAGFQILPLLQPLKALNVDGTENKQGTIRSYVNLEMKINNRTFPIRLFVTGLGKERIILGLPWLREQNPDINWKTGEFSWREQRKRRFFEPHVRSMTLTRRRFFESHVRDMTLKRLSTAQKEEEDQSHSMTKKSRDVETKEEIDEETIQSTSQTGLVDEWNTWRTLRQKEIEAVTREDDDPWGSLGEMEDVTDEGFWTEHDMTYSVNFDNENPKETGGDLSSIKSPKISVIEEIDEEERKNHTMNPMDDEDSCIAVLIEGTEDEQEPVWINVKTTASVEFHAKYDEKKEDLPLEEQIPKEYHEYLSIFSEKEASRFPPSRKWDHKIDLKPEFEPKSCKVYNLTPEEQVEQDKFLKENLEKGYIRPSESSMASPMFFVAKKDDRPGDRKLRPCQDYRRLNDATIKNTYPLPLISEIMDKLQGAKYFTKLDIRWGYNNVRIREGDEWKAAFKTNKGLFEPTVKFFGLCNSPATFQAMMDDMFSDLVDKGIMIVYMDDILIYGKTEDQLEENTKLVLERLRDADLYCKPKKCEFGKTKIEYLGMVVEEGKISMDPGKLRGIREWPTPTTVKQVRAFLGFGNFYRRFIRGFSDLAKPLNDLLKKDRTFDWTDDCQQAFDFLKQRFTEEPVLAMPDHSKPFQIEADASKYASGAVLTQCDINGDRHPVAYISKTFSPAKRNYDIYDRELLAIIRALEEWRHYIQGSPHQTTILSDHKNLTYYREAKKLN